MQPALNIGDGFFYSTYCLMMSKTNKFNQHQYRLTNMLISTQDLRYKTSVVVTKMLRSRVKLAQAPQQGGL